MTSLSARSVGTFLPCFNLTLTYIKRQFRLSNFTIFSLSFLSVIITFHSIHTLIIEMYVCINMSQVSIQILHKFFQKMGKWKNIIKCAFWVFMHKLDMFIFYRILEWKIVIIPEILYYNYPLYFKRFVHVQVYLLKVKNSNRYTIQSKRCLGKHFHLLPLWNRIFGWYN